MVMSQDQNAGRSHDMKIDISSFERVQIFGTLSNRNSIHGEITSRLKSGNACHQLVQNPLASSLLPKHIEITIHRTTNLPVVLYSRET
jgi:hypothetical protein